MSVSGRDPVILRGKIVSGTGKGRYYLRKEEFSTQFRRILGKSPYPGTLNVRVEYMDEKLLSTMDELKRRDGIRINGFRIGSRDYFPGISLSCTLLPPEPSYPRVTMTAPPLTIAPPIQDIPALIFFPEQTIHPPEILELISDQRILDVYELGHKVIVKV